MGLGSARDLGRVRTAVRHWPQLDHVAKRIDRRVILAVGQIWVGVVLNKPVEHRSDSFPLDDDHRCRVDQHRCRVDQQVERPARNLGHATRFAGSAKTKRTNAPNTNRIPQCDAWGREEHQARRWWKAIDRKTDHWNLRNSLHVKHRTGLEQRVEAAEAVWGVMLRTRGCRVLRRGEYRHHRQLALAPAVCHGHRVG